MIAVIFEVVPNEGRHGEYLEIAEKLKPLLAEISGFVSVERFQSITDANKMVSISFFKDEQAVAEWRRRTEHRMAQNTGRGGLFKDYRIRVASVMRDYSMNHRAGAPDDMAAL